MTKLAIQYVPRGEIDSLTSEARIKHIIQIVKGDKIVLLEGRLAHDEELQLYQKSIASVDKKFKGIEPAFIDSAHASKTFTQKVRSALANIILGQRQGLTVIGPATIVREIKQDPKKIRMFTLDLKRR